MITEKDFINNIRNVIIDDKYKGTCIINDLNTWSLRIQIVFNSNHPKFGKMFITKYFRFKNNKLNWGFNNESFSIKII